MSLTYLAIALLTLIGVENAESVVNSALIIISASVALYGRYRAGGINPFGLRK
jgi:hypothetical protein